MAQSDDREAEPEVFNQPNEHDGEMPDQAGPANGEREKTAAVHGSGRRLLNVEAFDDHQLLNAYAEGDEQAFENLVEKYFRMVYTVAGRQTGDWHLAQEIAQSVFLILSRKARGFSSKTPIPGWLLRTTRFVSWSAIKMRRRREHKERKFAVDLQEHVEMRPEPSGMEALLDEALQ